MSQEINYVELNKRHLRYWGDGTINIPMSIQALEEYQRANRILFERQLCQESTVRDNRVRLVNSAIESAVTELESGKKFPTLWLRLACLAVDKLPETTPENWNDLLSEVESAFAHNSKYVIKQGWVYRA